MYELLDLYPALRCSRAGRLRLKSLQLLAHSRAPLPMGPGAPAKIDYEYVRGGTTNLFVAVEPKAGHREVSVTQQRGKAGASSRSSPRCWRERTSARCVHASCWTT
ncbi:MAG: hypothetical protein U1F67_06590 [Rubrivivax sp.]